MLKFRSHIKNYYGRRIMTHDINFLDTSFYIEIFFLGSEASLILPWVVERHGHPSQNNLKKYIDNYFNLITDGYLKELAAYMGIVGLKGAQIFSYSDQFEPLLIAGFLEGEGKFNQSKPRDEFEKWVKIMNRDARYRQYITRNKMKEIQSEKITPSIEGV